MSREVCWSSVGFVAAWKSALVWSLHFHVNDRDLLIDLYQSATTSPVCTYWCSSSFQAFLNTLSQPSKWQKYSLLEPTRLVFKGASTFVTVSSAVGILVWQEQKPWLGNQENAANVRIWTRDFQKHRALCSGLCKTNTCIKPWGRHYVYCKCFAEYTRWCSSAFHSLSLIADPIHKNIATCMEKGDFCSTMGPATSAVFLDHRVDAKERWCPLSFRSLYVAIHAVITLTYLSSAGDVPKAKSTR